MRSSRTQRFEFEKKNVLLNYAIIEGTLSFLQLLWLESPTNPILKALDIEAISKVAHSYPDVRR